MIDVELGINVKLATFQKHYDKHQGDWEHHIALANLIDHLAKQRVYLGRLLVKLLSGDLLLDCTLGEYSKPSQYVRCDLWAGDHRQCSPDGVERAINDLCHVPAVGTSFSISFEVKRSDITLDAKHA